MCMSAQVVFIESMLSGQLESWCYTTECSLTVVLVTLYEKCSQKHPQLMSFGCVRAFCYHFVPPYPLSLYECLWH